jgi:membrane protein required for colicin V production
MTVAYALVFVAILILWGVLTGLLSRLLKVAGSDWSDRALGGMFGILRGGMILLVMAWMVGLTDYYAKPFWRDALTTGALEEAALATKSWLPDSIAQHIHYGSRK